MPKTVALKGAQLEVQFSGLPAFPIYASATDKFFLKIEDAQLCFERDPSGKVVAIVLHEKDQVTRLPKIAD